MCSARADGVPFGDSPSAGRFLERYAAAAIFRRLWERDALRCQFASPVVFRLLQGGVSPNGALLVKTLLIRLRHSSLAKNVGPSAGVSIGYKGLDLQNLAKPLRGLVAQMGERYLEPR
jgi:hypothetical protein